MPTHIAPINHPLAVAEPRSSPPPSACSEQSHDALKTDLTKWRSLPLDNYWFHAGTLHELRRCPRCGSSLMQRVEILNLRYPDAAA